MIEIHYNFESEIMQISGIETDTPIVEVEDFYVRAFSLGSRGIFYILSLNTIDIQNGDAVVLLEDVQKVLDILKKFFIRIKWKCKIDLYPKRINLNESNLRY